MSKRALAALLGGVLIGACQHSASAVPAVLTDGSDETLSALRSHLADAMGVVAEFSKGPTPYPATVNDEEQSELAGKVLAELVGEDLVYRDWPPTMGGEDFSFMLEERPGAFIILGNGDSAGLHHPEYNFNDEIIPMGCSWFAEMVERRMPAA